MFKFNFTAMYMAMNDSPANYWQSGLTLSYPK